MTTSRSRWSTTTHHWARDVDPEHLQRARACSESLGSRMATHLVLEVLAYADDEADSSERRGTVTVSMTAKGVAVTDDGRGTDTRFDEAGAPIRKPVMATPDVRFFDADEPPLLPDVLPRRGISTVAAVSPLLAHENHRHNGSWRQDYRYGIPTSNLQEIAPTGRTGTTVRFQLPPGIEVDPDRVHIHLQAFAHIDITTN